MRAGARLVIRVALRSAFYSPTLRSAATLAAGGVGFGLANLLLARVLPTIEFGVISLLLSFIQVGAAVGAPGLPVLKEPVYTLADYRQAVGGPAFPSHAIALTIDDGPHPVWTPKILRLLHKHHVPALFCMIGNQVLGHETTARDVAKDGHLLANHTWSHPTLLGKRRGRLVSKELHKAQEKIHDTTGREPVLFRSPGGDWSPTVLGMAAKQGLIPLDWNKDPNDWSRPGVPFITRRLMKAKPGDILLCHDGGGDRSQTYAALATVIPALKARGLQFVALDRKPQPRTT